MTTAATVESLQQAAARALADGAAAVVIGYGLEDGADNAVPVFVRTPEDAGRLVCDQTCFGDLAVYLTRPEVRALGRMAVVLKGCDRRAVNVLLREHVIERDEVYLIGVRCGGVGNPRLAKCAACDVHEPAACDVVAGEPVEATEADPAERNRALEAVEAMTPDERWAFWQRHLDRCIRCYACRQACPLCYCKRCIVEKSSPQWVETSPHRRGNLAWHLARALHLTGRCVECGECERVCPVDIPLGAINRKMAALVEQWFQFRSGRSADEQAPFSAFSTDDPEPGIL